MNKADLFWSTYLNLEDELIKLSRIIHFTDYNRKINRETRREQEVDNNHQMEVFSSHIADLLIKCCVEIEAISKELYFANGGTKQRGSTDIYFDTDCIDLLVERWKIDDKNVLVSSPMFDFKKEENKILKPLHKANERSKAYWAKCYQAVKHDRFNSLYLGNAKALLGAMAALYLLNIYFRDVKITIKYSELSKVDMSFGSRVFSLTKPKEKHLTDVINGETPETPLTSDECPLILKYSDQSYKSMLIARNETNNKRHEFFKTQPELQDPDFIKICLEKNKKDEQFTLVDLFVYRINKRIPSNLPYETKKVLLLSSPEWELANSSSIKYQEKDINEGNIQEKIQSVGTIAGYKVEASFMNPLLNKGFNDSYCEIVIDNGDIKYPTD